MATNGNWWDSLAPASPLDAALQAEGATGQQAAFARSLYQQESGAGQNTATSNAGAVGGMQVLPATFNSVADSGWDIQNPIDNVRAGIRYAGQMLNQAGGDPRLAAAGYYGGPGAIQKARANIALSDPRNPNAPDTLQYAAQVAGRMPSQGNWWESFPQADAPQTTPAASPDVSGPMPGGGYRVTITGTSADEAPRPQADASQGGVMSGIWQGLRDPVDAGAQLLRRAVPDSVGSAIDELGNRLAALGLWVAPSTGVQGVDQIVNDVNRQYDANRRAAGRSGFDAARAAGDFIGTLPAMRLGSAVGALAAPRALATLGGRIVGGAAQGATYEALMPVVGSGQSDFSGTKLGQIRNGAIAGGVAAPVLSGVARVISPKASQAGSNTQKLLGEGVQLTPGQATGGVLQTLEDKLMSWPITGDSIRAARIRGQESLNQALYNRVLSPIGGSTDKLGRAAVNDATQQVGRAYDDVLSKVTFAPDNAFMQSIANLRNMAQGGLPAREAQTFDQILQREVIGPMSQGQAITGETFKTIESQLGNQAQRFHGATDAYQNALGDALGEVQAALRDNLRRMNPEYAQRLADVNQSFAMLTRLQNAAGKVGAHDGVFTPQQLTNAVRMGDKTVRRNAYARGNALLQDLSDAAQSNMSSVIPDSGTAGRLLLTGGGLLGVGATTTPATAATIGGLLTAGAVPYLPGISRITTGLFAQRPIGAGLLADWVRRAPAGAIGAAVQ